MTAVVDKGSVVDSFHKILREMSMCRLNYQAKHCLNDQAQMMMISYTKSNWRPVIGGVLQWSVLVLILFNIFINDLDNGPEHILKYFPNYTKIN